MTDLMRRGAVYVMLVAIAVACGYLVVTATTVAAGIAVLAVLLAVGLYIQPGNLVLLAAMLAPLRNLDSIVGRLTPGALSLADVALVIFAISAWMRPAKRDYSIRRYMPFLALGCVVLGVAVVSMLHSGYIGEGLRRIGRMALAGACVLGAARSLDWDDAKRAVRGFVYSVTAVALIGIATTVVWIASGRATWDNADNLPRLWVGLIDPNHFGVMVAMALVVAAVWPGDTRRRWLWRSTLPILTAALIMTLSRGALLGALGGLALVGVLSMACLARGMRVPLGRGPYVVGALVALAIAGLRIAAPHILGLFAFRYSGLLSPESDSSAILRLRIQAAAETLIADNRLLGVGPGAVSLAMVRQGLFNRAWEVHSSFLELLVEIGYVGLVPYLVLLVGSLAWFARFVIGSDGLDNGDRLRIIGLGGAVVAGIFGSLTLSGVLFSAHFVILVMLLVVGCSNGTLPDAPVVSSDS